MLIKHIAETSLSNERHMSETRNNDYEKTH